MDTSNDTRCTKCDSTLNPDKQVLWPPRKHYVMMRTMITDENKEIRTEGYNRIFDYSNNADHGSRKVVMRKILFDSESYTNIISSREDGSLTEAPCIQFYSKNYLLQFHNSENVEILESPIATNINHLLRRYAATTITGYNVTMSLVLLSTSFIAMYQTSIAFTTSGTNLNTEAITLMNEGRVQVKIRESNTLSAVKNCSGFPIHEWHDSYIGVKLAMPEWEAILTTIVLAVIIVLTIIGNILVILSVFTYKPLRIVQNVFIVSLAVADLTVALLVLPFNVGYYILGRWEFGIIMCKLWLTCDIMCCTSSILNLCAIALDRYWAITDPINYAQKRTVQRVMFLITGVWMLSLFISSPPLLGWNDWPNEFTSASRCELNSNPSYIAYSSLGSFFIPLIIMACVYVKIYIATRRRIRERAETNALAKRLGTTETNENGVKNVSTLCRVTLWFCRQFSSFSVTPTMHNNNSSEINNDPECTQAVQDDIDIITVRRKNTHIPNIKDAIIHGNPRALEYDRDVSINMQHLRNVNFERCINKTNDNMTGGNDNEKTLLKIVPTQSSKSVHHFIKEKQKISLSKERRAARTLGIIMGVFVICWLPFFLMYVILPFCATCCLTTKFKNFITWLGYINSVLNPIIYTIFNLDYRRSFKRLLGLN